MGNSSEKNPNQQVYYTDIMTAINSVCSDYGLRTLNRGRHVPDVDKWVIDTEEIRTKEHCRLELFQGDLIQRKEIRWKWLKGKSFMPFQFYSLRGNVHCFGYKSMGNVIDYINKNNLLLGSQRESLLNNILHDILIGIRDLELQRLYHPKLTWENIEILHNGHGTISGLEYVKSRDEVNVQRLASRQHLPPECLKCYSTTQIQIETVQMWSLGSQLLAILINKYISGSRFDKPTKRMSRWRVSKHIHKNKPLLSKLLMETSLSTSTQTFLKGLLEINPKRRTTLEQALAHCSRDASSKTPITNNGIDRRQNVLDCATLRQNGIDFRQNDLDSATLRLKIKGCEFPAHTKANKNSEKQFCEQDNFFISITFKSLCPNINGKTGHPDIKFHVPPLQASSIRDITDGFAELQIAELSNLPLEEKK